jgi:hypothetical protein
MNIAELEKVAEIIGTMTQGAGEAFVQWVWLEIFENIWQASVAIVIICLLLKAITPLIHNGYAYTKMGEIRDLLGIGSPGHLTVSEQEKVIEAIRKLNTVYNQQNTNVPQDPPSPVE